MGRCEMTARIVVDSKLRCVDEFKWGIFAKRSSRLFLVLRACYNSHVTSVVTSRDKM